MEQRKHDSRAGISLLLIFFVLVGIFTPMMSMAEEPIRVHAYVDENGAPGAYKSSTCPFGGEVKQIGDSCCYGCASTQNGSYAHRGKVNITDPKALAVPEDSEEKYYKDEGNFDGPGYTTMTSDRDAKGKYTVKYYYCYNCSGKSLDLNDPALWMMTAYYNADGTLDTSIFASGIETGGCYDEWNSNDSKGDVPVRWCTHCGPLGAGYIITKYNPWHWPNMAEITVAFVKKEDGTAIADKVTKEVEKDTAFTYTAPAQIVYDGYTYEFSSWIYVSDTGGTKTGNTSGISFKVEESECTVQCFYEKAVAVIYGEAEIHMDRENVIGGSYNAWVENGEFTKVRVGWATVKRGESEGTVAFHEVAGSGTSATGTVSKTDIQNGYTYYLVVEATADGKTGKFYSNEVTITSSGGEVSTPTPTPEATATPTPTEAPEHSHSYGGWKHDSAEHWKECDCGAKSEQDVHDWQNGTPDDTGQVDRDCTVCGRSESVHQHDYVGWYPTDYWGTQMDENEWHWKVCSYCAALGTRGRHSMGEYEQEGGYMVALCTVCLWEMDRYPITVTLTINPNGGTFPDGSTEAISFTLQYDQVTDIGCLGPEYFPEKYGADFTGYFYVTSEGEGCVYTPDYDTKTCKAGSAYFLDNVDGTYSSRLLADLTVHAQWRASSYTVEYDPNGANGLMYPSYYNVGEEKALKLLGYSFVSSISYDSGGTPSSIATTLANTYVNASFLGWAETPDGPVVYSDGQVVKDILTQAGTVTLYAVWDYGTVTLPNAISTDGGYKLFGWEKEDGTVLSVLDDAGNYMEVSYAVHGNETFTAVWIPNTYTVSFDSDGGSACADMEVTYKQRYDYGNAGLPTPTKTGYIFKGWKHATTGTIITGSMTVTTAADHTLIAMWDALEVTVTLDYNFDFDTTSTAKSKNSTLTTEDDNTDSVKKKFNETVGTLPLPTMEGYTFAGWYLEESNENGCGETKCVVSTTYRVTEVKNFIIYARWTVDQYRVDLDYNRDYSIWGEE